MEKQARTDFCLLGSPLHKRTHEGKFDPFLQVYRRQEEKERPQQQLHSFSAGGGGGREGDEQPRGLQLRGPHSGICSTHAPPPHPPICQTSVLSDLGLACFSICRPEIECGGFLLPTQPALQRGLYQNWPAHKAELVPFQFPSDPRAWCSELPPDHDHGAPLWGAKSDPRS